MKIIQLIFIEFILLQVGQIIAMDSNINQKEIISGSLVDPCNDFQQYACASWSQLFKGAGTQYNDTIEMLDYNVNKEMSDILNNFSFEDKPKFIQEAYKYYKSCANLQGHELNKNLMLIDKNEDYQNEWFITLGNMNKYVLFDTFVSIELTDWKQDNGKLLIKIDKPSFETIDFDNFKIVAIYLETINDDATLNKLWLEIQDFEKELEDLTKIEDMEYQNIRGIEDLPLDWLKEYSKIILNLTELETRAKVYVKNIPYMKALDVLLNKYDQQFLNQYLKIRFLSYLVFQEFYELNEINCLSKTRNLMSLAMNWLYEQQHPELLKEYQNIYGIFDNVRNSFKKTIIENKYKFNESDVEFLLDKVNGMKLRLNNLPSSNTVDTLEEYYQDLNLNIDNFYENHLKLKKFIFEKGLDLVYYNEITSDFIYYSPEGAESWPSLDTTSNILMIPLTLLQQPIYSPDLDDIYKYSTLGFIISFELLTGFNTEHLSIDNNGVLSSVDFTEYPLFNESVTFLREIDTENVDEYIVYAGGIRYAYQTFFSLYPDAVHQTVLIKNREMSLSKVFFLNLIQVLCESAGKPHDAEYVQYALKYFPKFSETFKCTNKHLLYSNEDRHVW